MREPREIEDREDELAVARVAAGRCGEGAGRGVHAGAARGRAGPVRDQGMAGRRARSHIRQLQAPGFTVTITPAAA